ncbi:MAG TPA: SMC family ATPase, partial [Thermomicrobiales bacterium]|nr:SMC family ATPase [Thermomicrobiales bacterium]
AVTLASRTGGGQFIVERELKRSTTVAAIYEVDEGGNEDTIVQGTRQVSDYVANTLIGLSHSAFVATFFTRQKELHFFGNLGDTNRRREVGKLLGLETIRVAQQSIAEDRKRAVNAADAMLRQYEDQSAGRDFEGEIEASDKEIAERQAQMAAASASASSLASRISETEASLAALEILRENDAAIEQRIAQRTAESESMRERTAHIAAELDRLDARASQRAQLEPVAARLDSLKCEIAALDAERAKFGRRREVEQALRDLRQRKRDSLNSVRSIVEGVDQVTRVAGWAWSNEHHARPVEAVRDLVSVLDRLNVSAAEAREQALIQSRDLDQQLRRSGELLERYHQRRRDLDQELEALLAGGDPTVEGSALELERETLQERLATLAAEQTTLEGRRDQTRKLVRSLDEAHFEDRCPTCARPFSAEDAVIVTASLRTQIETITGELATIAGEITAVRARIAAVAEARKALTERTTQLVKVRSSIQASESHLADQQQTVKDHEAILARALQAAKLDAPPDTSTLHRANLVVSQYRQMAAQRGPLTAIAGHLDALARDEAAVDAEFATLADVTFDEDTYSQRVSDYHGAVAACTTIEQIDHDLERRPALERERAGLATGIEAALADLRALAKERIELGFNRDRLVETRTALASLRTDERSARDALHGAQSALREAEHARTSIGNERDRVRKLVVTADARRRDADDLDRMYREFTEFERYAAGRLTPLLGDMTSELVREITDDKYDRVEFDSNFGIEVFDGAEEHFPLDTFSGGERDAIALAARLALSRMIGSGAANPPGFLVLDEVFGSLDRDRRTRLLNLLGTICGTFDDFRQVFVVSHVDDVRTSAVFDELWRIDESSEGASQIRSLAAGEDIGEL